MTSKTKIIWTIREFTQILRQRQLNKFDCNIGVSGKRGDGKTQVKGNKVLMINGCWKKVEDIKIGDEIISPQEGGTFTYEKVTDIHSRFENKIYDICEATRKKRILYSCSWNHELPVFVPTSNRTSKDDSTPRNRDRKIKIWNAEKISKSKWHIGSHMCSFTIPAIEYKDKKYIEIDPYCLGVWLGDGHFSGDLGITSNDIEIINPFLKKYKVMNILNKSSTTAKTYRFSLNGKFSNQLQKLGLRYKNSGTKFIPESCFYTSIDYRLNLLAGLIDTYGFISKNNQITICTKSKRLSENIKRLVFSLGGYSIIRKIYKNCQSFKEKRKYYDISIQFKNPKKIPLKIQKKANRLKIRKIDPTMIAIKSVKRNSGSMVYGFSLSGNSKWYVTDNYMVTHNSTFLFKIFNSFKKDGFRQLKHQVYSQKDVLSLLANQTLGFCWDDEAINSGYKRDFQNLGQKTLIKVVTNYRDNFNIYASSLPFFYSLDKDLRELIFVHVHIIERGVGVILLPLIDQIHASDPWDTKTNIIIEQKESLRAKKNPLHKFRYHRLTTFAGYIYFGAMTPKQERIYKEIKKSKRSKSIGENIEKEKLDFIDSIYILMLENKLTSDGLLQICLREDKKYSLVLGNLGRMLRDRGEKRTPKDFLLSSKIRPLNSKNKGQIIDLVPSVPS